MNTKIKSIISQSAFITFLLINFCSFAQTIQTTQKPEVIIPVEVYEQMKESRTLKEGVNYMPIKSQNFSSNIQIVEDNSNVTGSGINERSAGRAVNACSCLATIDASFSVAEFTNGTSPDYRNDDGTTAAKALPFTFCMYGTNYTSFYINNNGNITFGSGYTPFTSTGFPSTAAVMVAPFWADVDTRNAASGLVYYKIMPTYVIVQWKQVGYYNQQVDKLNTFQCIITDGTDPIVPNANNVAFCYGSMNWTTGSASGGTNGFGGTAATVGVNKGDGVNFAQIGRFNQTGATFNGTTTPSGVNWLSNQSFYLNTCTSTNIPPIVTGINNCDTIKVCGYNDSVLLNATFLSPEIGQVTSVTVNLNATPGASVVSNTTGNVSSTQVLVVASALNAGSNVITFTATDNGTPPQSTFVNAIVYVDTTGLSSNNIVMNGTLALCQGNPTTLSVSPTSADSYLWNTGATTTSINVTTPGNYWVTSTLFGCSKTIEVAIPSTLAATFSYTGSPFCQNVSNPSPIFVANSGAGTFTSSPAGLSINAATGVINLAGSTPGTYTVTNTIAATSVCPSVSATASVIITAAPSAAFSYLGSPYCISAGTTATPTFTGGATAGTFTSSPAGLSIDAFGNVNTSLSTVGTYTVTNTIAASGGCAAVIATATINITATAVATFSYVGTPFCHNAPNQLPTYSGGGVAGFFTSTPAGLVINSLSGMVAVSASAPGTYTVKDSVPASGACGAGIGTSTITISAVPHATFNYIPTHYCNNGSNPIPTFSGGGTAGTFSAPSGIIFVSTTTGEVDVANSTPGTYTITNTVIGGGCPNSTATSTITITRLSVPTFTYATPYCQSVGTATPTFTGGGVSGTFSSTSPTLFIDPSTGIIDLISSTPGTDTVVNTIPATGGCPTVSDTVSITIIAGQAVSPFYYPNDPYCQNGANPLPTVIGGGSAGIFSSSSGLVIDSITGEINIQASVAGTYTVLDTLSASTCSAGNATASITINPAPDGTFSYAGSPYCQTTASNPSPTLGTGAIAGIFSCASPLLVIDSITGVINIQTSIPGTYTITNSIPPTSGCLAVTATTTITIDAPSSATFNYPNSPYCQSSANAIPTFTGGGVPGTFTSTAGLIFVSATTGEVDFVSSLPGTYTVTNTLPANACPGATATATITINLPAVATFSYSGSPYCAASGATPTPVFSGGGVAGTFSSTTGLSLDASTGVININASTPGTYTITNSIAAVGGCPAITATATITINALQTGTFGYSATNYCQIGNTSPINVATLGGIFTSTAGLSINASSGAINLAGSTLGTYTVTYTTPGPCAGTGTATVTISAAPTATAVNTATIDCHTGTVSLNGAGSSSGASVSYLWTTSNGNIVSGATTLTPVVNQAGTYTLTVTNSLTNCTSVATVTVTGVAAPVASFTANPSSGTPPLTVNFTNTSSNATSYSWSFPGGTPASASGLNATTTYSVTGTYTAYLTANNSSGCTSRDSMKIEVYDGYSMVIPNAFSPNGDNINDLFTVKSTGVLSITCDIYDRWGLKLYTLTAPNEGWDGHTTSGESVPEGTYYYIVISKGFDGIVYEDKGFITLFR